MAKEKWKELTAGNIVKFENAGDCIEGTYVGYEESKQFPGSYAVTVFDNDSKSATAFVSGIVIDLINRNSIKTGDMVKVEFKGKRKTLDNKREYNDYKVYLG